MLLIDEIAALTAWITDRTMQKRIDSALSLLLTQGRAVGVVVVGALQDPRKDVIPQRDLFPIRVGLRGQRSRARPPLPGHRCAQPRRALRADPRHPARRRLRRRQDGIPDPVRVRFAWHSDDDHRPADRPARWSRGRS